MSENPLAPASRAKELAQTAQAAATIAIIVVIANTVAQHFGEPTFEAMRTQEVTSDLAGIGAVIKVLGASAILAMPSFLLLGALLDLRAVLGEFEIGKFYSQRASSGLRSAGEWTLWALAAKILISPSLYAIVIGEPRGVVTDFASFDLGLIAFAIFVTLAGRILEAAAELKAENDAMI